MANFLLEFFSSPKIVFIISIFVFIFSLGFSSSNMDPSTLISAILQSLASLLAIITAFTLIAVQLSSQTYSPRLLKMFVDHKNNQLFWILIGIYLISMIYCLFLLINLDSKNPPTNLQLLFANLGLLLAFWCYILIPTYILDTIDRLKPESIMRDLNKLIDKDLIAEIFKRSQNEFVPEDCSDMRHLRPDKDPLIALVDIIIGAIKESHTNTAETGLRFLCNSFKKLIDDDSINKKNGKKVYQYLLEHLERVKFVSVKNEDSKTLDLLIRIINKIGYYISEKDPECNLFSLIFLGDMSLDILEIRFESEALHIIATYERLIDNYLNNIGKNDKIIWDKYFYIALRDLKYIWVNSTEKRIINIMNNSEIVVTRTYRNVIDKGFLEFLNNEIFFLMNFGIMSIDETPETLDSILMTLHDLYNSLFKNYMLISEPNRKLSLANSLILNIIEALKNIGQESIYKNKYDIKIGPYFPLEEIVDLRESTISKIINIHKDIAISYLTGEICGQEDKNEMEQYQEIIKRVINYIGVFSLQLAQNKSFSVSSTIDASSEILEKSLTQTKINRLSIASEIIDLLDKLSISLIENQFADKIPECTLIFKKIIHWADEYEISQIRESAIKELGKIGLEMVNYGKLIAELRRTVQILEEITFENINKNSERFTRLSLIQIQDIVEKMYQMRVNESEIQCVSNSIDLIKKSLAKSEMEGLIPEIGNWEKMIHNKYIYRRT